MEDTNEKGFLQPEFFTCSIDKSCSYVIKYKKTNKFKIVKNKIELESLKEPVTLWEKMPSVEGKHRVSYIPKLGYFIKGTYYYSSWGTQAPVKCNVCLHLHIPIGLTTPT